MVTSRVAISLVLVFTLVLRSTQAKEPASQTSDSKRRLFYFEHYRTLVPNLDPKQLEIWQKTYRYESLADRLAYESTRGKIVPPRLTEESQRRLQQTDQPTRDFRQVDNMFAAARVQTLRNLHNGKLGEFVRANGFGESRTPITVRSVIQIPEPTQVTFDKVSPLSAEFDTGEALTLPTPSQVAPSENVWRLPTQARLTAFHIETQEGFASAFSLGDVQSVDRVLGFVEHGFHKRLLPPENEAIEPSRGVSYSDPKINRWRMVRLELVSLLKYPTPAVYVSEHLPNMHELANAKTRPLTKFEAESLAKLQDGDDLVEHSTANQIDMLGSVRAAKKCVDCHSVPHGTLLGAFSYQLQRDPPIKAPVPR